MKAQNLLPHTLRHILNSVAHQANIADLSLYRSQEQQHGAVISKLLNLLASLTESSTASREMI